MISFTLHKVLQSAQGQMSLDVSCELPDEKLTAIYGASGAGKTTILRMLAGLLRPDSGKIANGGDVWLDTQNETDLSAQKRKVGIVFQDYALFPNMTVKGNLEYALEKGNNKRKVQELIEIMELQQLQDRYPATLSGGQKQRVALARALVRRPQLLLLDEPLSALDTEMRARLQDHILQVHKHFKLTTILVSHDISELYKMSDQILVLEEGKITRQGAPAEIFVNTDMSGKFRFTGQVIDISKEDIIYVVSLLIGNNIVKVVATESDICEIKEGDNVLVSSKAFNPIIRKIEMKP